MHRYYAKTGKSYKKRLARGTEKKTPASPAKSVKALKLKGYNSWCPPKRTPALTPAPQQTFPTAGQTNVTTFWFTPSEQVLKGVSHRTQRAEKNSKNPPYSPQKNSMMGGVGAFPYPKKHCPALPLFFQKKLFWRGNTPHPLTKLWSYEVHTLHCREERYNCERGGGRYGKEH